MNGLTSGLFFFVLGIAAGSLISLQFLCKAPRGDFIEPYFPVRFGQLTEIDVEFFRKEIYVNQRLTNAWLVVHSGAAQETDQIFGVRTGLEIRFSDNSVKDDFERKVSLDAMQRVVACERLETMDGIPSVAEDLDANLHSDIWPGGGVRWFPRRVLEIHKFIK